MEVLRRILAIIMAVALAVSVMLVATSCGGDEGGNNNGDGGNGGTPCNHFDINKDNKCDACGEDYTEPDTRVELTITVVDEAGAAIAGVEVIVLRNGTNVANGTTDANGQFKTLAHPNKYSVLVDGLPENWFVGIYTIELSAENKALRIVAIDNTPDGSAGKPFFLGDDEATYVMPAGASYNFIVRGMNRTLKVYNANAKVIYDGNEYTANDDGVVEVFITGTSDTFSATPFVIQNLLDGENSVRVHFESPLGSVGNPYEAALDAPITASVPKGETVYYAWTATANGILILTAESDGSSIMLYNYTSFAVTGYTEGKGCVYVYVTEGDEVSIPVASNLPGDTNEVVFSLALSPATESAPMSIKAGNTTVKFSTGTTYYYVYSDETADAAIRAENVTVTVNGEAVTAAAGDRYIRFVANAGDVISITNTSEGNEDITLTLTKQG